VWDDYGRRSAEALERGKVKVNVVEVRDEYPVESVERLSIHRRGTPEMRYSVAKAGSVRSRAPSSSTRTVL
jgi:ribosomal 50S subunit-recycling heat shock protein